MTRPSSAPIPVPESRKKEGLRYAFAPNGFELPVIDLGHPAFRVDEGEVEVLLEAATAARRAPPPIVQALLSRLMPRFSVIAREIADAQGGFMSGLGTYLMKLGPDNLGPGYNSGLDKKIVGSVMGLNARLRLRATSALLAELLLPPLEEEAGRGLLLLDIGGGPAADGLNTLMMLRRRDASLLEGRRIGVEVLDIDEEGPLFGEACLAALRAEGAALEGLDIGMRRVAYDWNEVSALGEILRDAGIAIIAATTEGGLFEYGSDFAIEANLRAFAEGGAALIVGSLSRRDGAAGALNGAAGAAIRAWEGGGEAFEALAGRCGWRISRRIETPLSRIVALERAEAYCISMASP